MEKFEHNLETEERLLSLLGYTKTGPNNSNRWTILDKNGVPVGHIQYKKLHDGNAQNNYTKTYCYEVEINSSEIHYENIRPSDQNSCNYKFKIIRNGDINECIEMYIGPCGLNIALWSSEYGHVSFTFNVKDGNINNILIKYATKGKVKNIREILDYTPSFNYTYRIEYCDEDVNMSSLFEPSFLEIKGNRHYEHSMELSRLRKGHNARVEYYDELTVDDLAKSTEKEFGCFKRFIKFLNKILPFKDNIICTLINMGVLDQNALLVLLDNPDKELENTSSK